jgi:hypothetical protein
MSLMPKKGANAYIKEILTPGEAIKEPQTKG